MWSHEFLNLSIISMCLLFAFPLSLSLHTHTPKLTHTAYTYNNEEGMNRLIRYIQSWRVKLCAGGTMMIYYLHMISSF